MFNPASQYTFKPNPFKLAYNEKDSILGIENTMESKPTHHEIEEEVASLLLDIRDRCDPTDTYETSPKRRIIDSFERELLQKKRKINRESARPEDDINEEDEEYRESEHHNDDDDYYHDEEDDDEWMENRNNGLLGLRNPTETSSPRIPRKKAPSGTACEKHKRWKKRCPDDCPMRKAKTRRSGKMTRSQSMELKYDYYQDYEEQGSPLSVGEAESFSELSEDKNLYRNSSYEIIRQEDMSPPYSETRNVSGPSKTELLSLISWSMQQLSQESNLSQEDIYVIQAQLARKANLAHNTTESFEQIGDILDSCKQVIGNSNSSVTSSPAHVITIGPKGNKTARAALPQQQQQQVAKKVRTSNVL
jgi:hypothetical protein